MWHKVFANPTQYDRDLAHAESPAGRRELAKLREKYRELLTKAVALGRTPTDLKEYCEWRASNNDPGTVEYARDIVRAAKTFIDEESAPDEWVVEAWNPHVTLWQGTYGRSTTRKFTNLQEAKDWALEQLGPKHPGNAWATVSKLRGHNSQWGPSVRGNKHRSQVAKYYRSKKKK
jgi:hypothetical protein